MENPLVETKTRRSEMKKFRLATKLSVSFVIVALLVLLVGLIGWGAVSQSEKIAFHTAQIGESAQKLMEAEIGHLQWMEKVKDFKNNEHLTDLEVEKDETKCPFGKWLNSNDRKKFEVEMADLGGMLSKIDESHRKVHASVILLEKKRKGGDFVESYMVFEETAVLARNIQGLLKELKGKTQENL